MPYVFDAKPATTAAMRGNRRVNTVPERRLRSALQLAGLRFRKDFRVDESTVRVRVDIAFPRVRVLVFVDGCFWHSCPEHGTAPVRNSAYWAPKLARNLQRDRRVDEALSGAGWRVLRVWEHEPVPTAVATIVSALSSATEPAGSSIET